MAQHGVDDAEEDELDESHPTDDDHEHHHHHHDTTIISTDLQEQLMMMGFPEDWCAMALRENDNDIISASSWIVDNLDMLTGLSEGDKTSEEEKEEAQHGEQEEDEEEEDANQERAMELEDDDQAQEQEIEDDEDDHLTESFNGESTGNVSRTRLPCAGCLRRAAISHLTPFLGTATACNSRSRAGHDHHSH